MARTAFGRWVRDRLRRALGVADLAGRAEETDAKLVALADRVEALGTGLGGVPGGVDAVGEKLNAVAGRLDALSALADRQAATAAHYCEQVQLRVSEQADRVSDDLAARFAHVGDGFAHLADGFARLDAALAALPDADVVAGLRALVAQSESERTHLRAEVDRLGGEVRRLEGEKDPRTPDLLAAADQGRLLKLEYPPSYDSRARWGYSRPSHAGLAALFATQDAHYRDELRELVARLPRLQAINRHFSHDRPGWPGGWAGR